MKYAADYSCYIQDKLIKGTREEYKACNLTNLCCFYFRPRPPSLQHIVTEPNNPRYEGCRVKEASRRSYL